MNHVNFEDLINYTIVGIKKDDMPDKDTIVVKLRHKNGMEMNLLVSNYPDSNVTYVQKYREMGTCYLCTENDYLSPVEWRGKIIDICTNCITDVKCPICGDMNPSYTCYYDYHNVLNCQKCEDKF